MPKSINKFNNVKIMVCVSPAKEDQREVAMQLKFDGETTAFDSQTVHNDDAMIIFFDVLKNVFSENYIHLISGVTDEVRMEIQVTKKE